MATIPVYPNSIVSTTSTGSLIYSNANNNISISSGGYQITLNEGTTDFFELVLAALGYDITYESFTKLSKEERNQIIRDIKLKTII
jgi:hypothetical protein